jgi:hypothetical protein
VLTGVVRDLHLCRLPCPPYWRASYPPQPPGQPACGGVALAALESGCVRTARKGIPLRARATPLTPFPGPLHGSLVRSLFYMRSRRSQERPPAEQACCGRLCRSALSGSWSISAQCGNCEVWAGAGRSSRPAIGRPFRCRTGEVRGFGSRALPLPVEPCSFASPRRTAKRWPRVEQPTRCLSKHIRPLHDWS